MAVRLENPYDAKFSNLTRVQRCSICEQLEITEEVIQEVVNKTIQSFVSEFGSYLFFHKYSMLSPCELLQNMRIQLQNKAGQSSVVARKMNNLAKQILFYPKSARRINEIQHIQLSDINRDQEEKFSELIRASLKCLHITNSNLETFAPIWNSTRLEILTISYTNLASISPGIREFFWLTHLNLSNNQLESVPDEIWKLPRLRLLDLSHNKIAEITKNITHAHFLDELSLESNQLQTLPIQVSNINLKLLDLRDNPIHILPQYMERLTGTKLLFGNSGSLWISNETIQD